MKEFIKNKGRPGTWETEIQLRENGDPQDDSIDKSQE